MTTTETVPTPPRVFFILLRSDARCHEEMGTPDYVQVLGAKSVVVTPGNDVLIDRDVLLVFDRNSVVDVVSTLPPLYERSAS